VTGRRSAALCLAAALGLPLALAGEGSADTASPPTVTKATVGHMSTDTTPVFVPSTSSADVNVAPNGPLAALAEGTVVRVTIGPTAGNAGKFTGTQARLCKGEGDIKLRATGNASPGINNTASYSPSQGGNCIDKPFNAQSDDFLEPPKAPEDPTLTFDFRIGTGTVTVASTFVGPTTITCGAGHPCTLWLKESVSTDLIPSGVAWIHYDLVAPGQSGTTTTVAGPTTTTVAGATTTTVAGATTTSTSTTSSTNSSTTSTTLAGTTTTTSVGTTTTTAPPAFTIAPLSTESGGTIKVTSTGWKAGSTVEAVINSDPVRLGSTTADASGAVNASFVVPAGFAAGDHSVTLSGLDAAGATRTLTASVSVTDPTSTSTATTAGPGTGTLSRTGADVIHDLWSAWGLIVAGILLVVTVLRRERLARR